MECDAKLLNYLNPTVGFIVAIFIHLFLGADTTVSALDIENAL